MTHRPLARMLGLASLTLFMNSSVLAGGPWGIYNGTAIKYPGAGTVVLNYDQGALGIRSKALADAKVTEAVSLWTNVTTATVSLSRGPDLLVNVDATNYLTYFGALNASISHDGLNPVVYDSDGAILDLLFGVGARNSLLGIAGSSYQTGGGVSSYVEGRAIINGYLAVDDITLKMVIAHEVGHLIGLVHTQLDSSQGLLSASPSNYPLMYPIVYRDYLSLHEDDVASVSALYPDASLSSLYGQLSGTFVQPDGTPIPGANLWVEETSSHQVFSVVSDYLMQNTGYFKLLLPAGTYTLHAQAIRLDFYDGSSVGPYSNSSSDLSFQAPLYVGGVAMAPLALGNATPIQIVMTAGCAASASFRFDGTGSVGANCASPPGTPTNVSMTSGPGSVTVTFTSPGNPGSSSITGYSVTCTAFGQTTRTQSGTASPIRVTGLRPGVAYACTISASNASGPGLPSAPVTVTARNIDLTPILMLLLD